MDSKTADWRNILHPWTYLKTDRSCHGLPTLVFLSFEPTKVGRSNRKAAVVEKLRDLLDRFAGITPELRGAVPEDMHAARR